MLKVGMEDEMVASLGRALEAAAAHKFMAAVRTTGSIVMLPFE